MPFSPMMQPCSPNPVCGPAPVPRLPAQSPFARLAGFVRARLVKPVCDWRARERLYQEMSSLDHRELRDLGLTEYDVDSFVRSWRPGQRRRG